MKKIILSLTFLFSVLLTNAQTGVATASAQTRSNLLLKYLEGKNDSIITQALRTNLLLKYTVDKADSIITAQTRSNLLLKYSVDKSDSIITALTRTNLLLKYNVDKADSMITKLTRTNLLTTYSVDKSDSLITINKAIESATLSGLSLHSKITYTNNSVAKASAGVLYGFYVYNSNAAGQYIQFFNSATVPADATAPYITSFYVPALSSLSFNTGNFGWSFDTGISWSNSTTVQTKTIGASDVQITITYK